MIDFNADMNKALADLISAAKEVGGEAFPMLVKRAIVSGYVHASGCAVVFIAIWSGFVGVKRWLRKNDSLDDDDRNFGAIMSLVIASMISIFAFVLGLDALRDILAPEGYVLWALMGK